MGGICNCTDDKIEPYLELHRTVLTIVAPIESADNALSNGAKLVKNSSVDPEIRSDFVVGAISNSPLVFANDAVGCTEASLDDTTSRLERATANKGQLTQDISNL